MVDSLVQFVLGGEIELMFGFIGSLTGWLVGWPFLFVQLSDDWLNVCSCLFVLRFRLVG